MKKLICLLKYIDTNIYHIYLNMNLKDDDIVDDVSESSDDFESDNEKNDNDDLEEDKGDIDSDSDIESIEEDEVDDDDGNEDNDEEIVTQLPLNSTGKQHIDDDAESDDYDSDEDGDEFDDDMCLQKLNNSIKTNLISEFHPELMEQNESEIELMSTVVRNSEGVIIDDFHRSIPFITKYERARVIGERTRQINSGATPFVDVEPDIIDGYIIAVNEFNKKKIPFIIKRPLPSGKCEYWKLSDLEIL
jgi:DNA-directed RNA polymerase I, II, and III subunit RPABC2